MLCRKSLATFDCVAAGVDSTGASKLLRDDPVVFCSTSSIIPRPLPRAFFMRLASPSVLGGWHCHRREVQREEQKKGATWPGCSQVKRKSGAGLFIALRIYKDQYWYSSRKLCTISLRA